MTFNTRLRDNASSFARRARAAPRAGNALLAGLVACGHCGRQLHAVYRAQPWYRCAALQKVYGRTGCLHLAGPPIDAAVVEAFFAAVAPAELDLLDEVLTTQQADHARLVQQHADQVARAEYEARLAQRQYQAVDPDHRLVAAELERRWEVALQALAATREAAERFAQRPPTPTLDPMLRAQLQDLSHRLPELWASERLEPLHKKELLRSLIRRVVLTRPEAATLEGKIRRACGVDGVRQQFRSRDRIEGQWTIYGLARALHVRRTWLYSRIAAGAVPAHRHAVTGHYLIPDDPALLERLRAQRPAGRRVTPDTAPEGTGCDG